MTCATCTKTLPIPQCSGVLILGSVDVAEAIAVIKDVLTGRERMQQEVDITGGVASINISAFGAYLTPNFTYELTLYESTETYGTPVEVTIDEIGYTCFQLNFNKVVDIGDGEISAPEDYQLLVYGLED